MAEGLMDLDTEQMAAGELPNDDELTALALAAESDPVLGPDSVPMSTFLGGDTGAALPIWYMPPVLTRELRGWRVALVIGIVMAFVVIDALGLCGTYGSIVLA